MSDPRTTLILLRHGEVASHQGDVPVTPEGLLHAVRTGEALAARFGADLDILYGGTRRTRETAEALLQGLGDSAPTTDPVDSFALRNPDIYVAGTRVNMVSSPETLAEQVPGMSTEQAAAHPWFSQFFDASDRIGWWLAQDSPPGDNARALAQRVTQFVTSLADPGPHIGRVVIGVTHSPVLRAVLTAGTGADPGEPAYVTGALLRADIDGSMAVTRFDPLSP